MNQKPIEASHPALVIVILLLICGVGIFAAIGAQDSGEPVPADLGPGKADLEFGQWNELTMQYDPAESTNVIEIETDYQVELRKVGPGEWELWFVDIKNAK